MICPYCEEREGTKSNTHYLSDNIIRSALNKDGTNKKENGLYVNMSNNSIGVEFNFQRSTPQLALEDALKRPPNEQEIEKAKTVPCSVDNIFCPECEKSFTTIENDFTDNILPKLRDADLSEVKDLEFEEVLIIRKFFSLQIWRSSICDDDFNLSQEIEKEIRDILYLEDRSFEDLKKYPLCVTYLNTVGEKKTFTLNYVGFSSDENPYIILMNDFVIQFYSDEESIMFFDFHNLNDKGDFRDYINVNENTFKIRVKSNEERIQFSLDIAKESKGELMVKELIDKFSHMYLVMFKRYPKEERIQDYLNTILGKEKESIDKFSSKVLFARTFAYLKGIKN